MLSLLFDLVGVGRDAEGESIAKNRVERFLCRTSRIRLATTERQHKGSLGDKKGQGNAALSWGRTLVTLV